MSGAPVAELAAASFFDPPPPPLRELFAGTAYVWEALARIPELLRALGPGRLRGRVAPGAWLEGEGIHVEEGATVEPGAYIVGPCWIGRESEVRHGAYLRGNVVVGAGCVVGHATEVKNAVFLDRARAGHFAYVGDSILGHRVNLGAGTKLANLRLDDEVVSVRLGGGRVSTGRRKLGAVLGDGVETGCNSVLNPGTFLGRGARVLACTSVAGFHAPGSVIGERPRRAL